jgi:hypothetical protein
MVSDRGVVGCVLGRRRSKGHSSLMDMPIRFKGTASYLTNEALEAAVD